MRAMKFLWLGVLSLVLACGDDTESKSSTSSVGHLPVSVLRTTHELAGIDWNHAYNIITLTLEYLRMTEVSSGVVHTSGRLHIVDVANGEYSYEASSGPELEVDFASEAGTMSRYIIQDIDVHGREFQGAADFFFEHHIQFRYFVPGWISIDVDSRRVDGRLVVEVAGEIIREQEPVNVALNYVLADDASSRTRDGVTISGWLQSPDFETHVDAKMGTSRSATTLQQTQLIRSTIYLDGQIYEYDDVFISQRSPLKPTKDPGDWTSEVSGRVLLDGQEFGRYQLVDEPIDETGSWETTVKLATKTGAKLVVGRWINGGE
ncbi:MAG: hypothetical protein KTR25_05295 [Myxococcales bacterium]|nr:hypothetical protein [Myxococcales bacterium]